MSEQQSRTHQTSILRCEVCGGTTNVRLTPCPEVAVMRAYVPGRVACPAADHAICKACRDATDAALGRAAS